MSELTIALITVGCTFLVLIFVQIILELYIKPISELRRQIAETINLLDYYARELTRFEIPKDNSNNPIDENDYSLRKNQEIERRNQGSIAFRDNAFSIRAKLYAISFYPTFAYFNIAPDEKTVLKIVRCNTGLSNQFFNYTENAKKEINLDIKETNDLLKQVFKNYKDKYEEEQIVNS